MWGSSLFISNVIWNESDVQNNVFSEVRSQYRAVIRKWEKSTINTHFWLSLLQNESEINYVGEWFKAYNLALIGKHIWTCLFLPKAVLLTQYDRIAHFVIVRLNSLKNWRKMNDKWWFLVRVFRKVPNTRCTQSLASNFFNGLKN